mgnify:CR=1 FL=1
MAEVPAECDLVAERIRAGWRDLRRAGSTGPVRAYLYEPDLPLDVAQADALDLIVSHAPVRMSDVASLLHVDPSTATRTVARLQQLALVERTADPVDARVVLVVPSEAGRRLHDRVRLRANELLSEILATFDVEDRERLASLMERLMAAVDAWRGAPGASAPSPSDRAIGIDS